MPLNTLLILVWLNGPRDFGIPLTVLMQVMTVLTDAFRRDLLPLNELLLILDVHTPGTDPQLGSLVGMSEGCLILADFWLLGYAGVHFIRHVFVHSLVHCASHCFDVFQAAATLTVLLHAAVEPEQALLRRWTVEFSAEDGSLASAESCAS